MENRIPNMPWIGDNARFPRPGDDGFDGFEFTSEQTAVIDAEARENAAFNTAADIVRALAKLDMDSERDFLMAVRTAAETVV